MATQEKIQPTSHIWADGQLVDWDNVVLHVASHTLHYGGGAFEGMRVYETDRGPAIFRALDHMERLLHSAHSLQMRVPYSAEQLVEAARYLVRVTGLQSGYIRPLIVFGEGHMKLLPTADTPVNVYIMCWPWAPLLGDKPARVTVTNVCRPAPEAFDPTVKINGAYVNSIRAIQEAHGRGFDEALMLDAQGNIAEGSGENIFFVRDNILYTPQLGNILPGITRDTIVTLAKELAISSEEVTWTPEDIVDTTEAFFTGTAAEVSPISEIDNVVFPNTPGPVTQQLRELYLDSVQGRISKYKDWLTYCN